MTSVQLYLADTEVLFQFDRLQSIQLFRSLPKGKVKTDYYLLRRGNRALFSPAKSREALCVGGAHRLRLLEPLLPLADCLKVFAHPQQQSTTWQLYFGPLRFSLTLSRDSWRGFSGEGAALEALVEDIPDTWISRLDNYSYANQEFNPTMLAIEEDLNMNRVDQLTARLSAMGLLGFDLDENHFFYRRLPFKLSQVMSFNPRLKNAEKLLEANKVQMITHSDERIEAQVEGSGVKHTVLIQGGQARCTCTWFSQHQGERGACKHILAVKKKLTHSS